MSSPQLHLPFPHHWQAEILATRPMILPPRSFVYPAQVDEVERGALEVMIWPTAGAPPFLATCALGFRDPAVSTGLWSCPDPDQVCAVSGGYAYVIAAGAPERFAMIPFRPVLEVRAAVPANLLLFVSHHRILAWGADGQAWESAKLSDEGLTLASVDEARLHGTGWDMLTDRETPFTLDLMTGQRV